MNIIAHVCNTDEIQESKKMFSKIDKNNDGYITLNELKNALKNKYDDVALQKIIRSIDSDKNGAINYTEFIAATLTASILSDD